MKEILQSIFSKLSKYLLLKAFYYLELALLLFLTRLHYVVELNDPDQKCRLTCCLVVDAMKLPLVAIHTYVSAELSM